MERSVKYPIVTKTCRYWYKESNSWVPEEEPGCVLEALGWRKGAIEIGIKVGMLRGWVEVMAAKEEPTRGTEATSREFLVASKS